LSLLSKLTDPLFAGGSRSRQRAFLQAAMASAALTAAADGPVSLAKRHTLDQILSTVDLLRAIEVHEAVAVFDGYVDAIKDSPKIARAKALGAIAVLADDATLAPLLLRIAAAMARADGAISPAVQEEVTAIAAALSLPPPDLGDGEFLDNRRATVAGISPGVIGVTTGGITIVLGNEKGGTGKSTTAMHLAVALLKSGHRVASIDLDGRQGTLSRYIAHRAEYAARGGEAIPMPLHTCIAESDTRDRDEGLAQDRARLRRAFAEAADCAFVVIDTPGSNSRLSHLAHAHADVLITPLNDSFFDVDVLARIDRERREVQGPSPYSEMVWAQSEQRVAAGRPPIDWVVMRNRLAHIDARNSRDMSGLLGQLAERLRFRLIPGFGERVIYREMFYRGLTLFDLPQSGDARREAASHVHARQEVQELVDALGIAALGREKHAAHAGS
jgi:chromosome partitioning protein